jgi:hypothetical protein
MPTNESLARAGRVGDRLPDLVCTFNSRKTGLRRTDTVALLQGATAQGAPIQGQDRISI